MGRARALGGRRRPSAAFQTRDTDLATDLARQDREVNRLNREVFRLAIEVGDDPDTREWAMHMTMIARALERIGDNAVDIGEQTVFVVSGLFREFPDRPGRRHAGGLRPRPSVHPIRPRAPESSQFPA